MLHLLALSIDVPFLTGGAWILPVFGGLAIIMIVKWFIDILP